MRVCWWVFGPFLPGSGWCALSQAFTVAAARASPSGMQEWLQHHAASSEMIATALCGQKAAMLVCVATLGRILLRRGQPVRLLRGLFASVSTAASSICICHSLQWSSYIRSLTALYAGEHISSAARRQSTQTDHRGSSLHTSTPAAAMPRSSGLVLALAASSAALRDSRVTPCPLYTPKITLNQPPRVATLAMG